MSPPLGPGPDVIFYSRRLPMSLTGLLSGLMQCILKPPLLTAFVMILLVAAALAVGDFYARSDEALCLDA